MIHLIRFRSLLAAATLFTAAGACSTKSETRQQADRAAEAVEDRTEDLKDEARDLAETAEDRSDDSNAVDEVHRPAAVVDNSTPNPTAPTTDTILQRTPHDGRDSVGEVSAYIGKKAGVARERVADGVEDIADDAKDVGKHAGELEEANNEFKYRKMVRIETMRAVHAVAASQPMVINAFAQFFPLVDSDRAEVNEKLVIFQMRLDEAGNAIQSLDLVEAGDWEPRDDAASKSLERVEDAREEVWESLRDADRIGDRTSMR